MHQKGTLHLDAMHQKGILHPDAMHQKGALHLDAMHQKGALYLDAMHQNGTLHLDAITIAPVITMLDYPNLEQQQPSAPQTNPSHPSPQQNDINREDDMNVEYFMREQEMLFENQHGLTNQIPLTGNPGNLQHKPSQKDATGNAH